MAIESTAVLVVGGGLVGLSTAMFLAWHGVPTVLVEKHPGSSLHPRAIGYTPRTIELLRAVGIEDRVPQAPPGLDGRPRRVRVESLAGSWSDEAPWTPPDRNGRPGAPVEYSPVSGTAIAQDRMEPLLRNRAAELGADLRFGTTLLGFTQDADGVTAALRRADGSESHLRASYLVAADGHRSPVREALGIGRTGRGYMRTVRSVLFRAPLDAYLERGISQFEIDQPDLTAFLTTYRDGRWVLMFTDDEARDAATLEALIAKAIGRPDVPVEIITTGRWELSALIAERFAAGRVFLAGDAAHTLPPARGGFGANTGIEDAHNLAWKLAAVVGGTSAPALLDSYDAERRPIAWLRHDQIFARPDYRAEAGPNAPEVAILEDDAIEFGQLYRSTAVLDTDASLPEAGLPNGGSPGVDLPPALRPDQWAGRPGTRAPHQWVTRDGTRRSTLDLFQRGWVLLADDARWAAATAQAGDRLGIAVECLRLGVDVQATDDEAFRTAFGLGAGGASLIRPDGYVGWRAATLPTDAARALTNALERVAAVTTAAAAAASVAP